MLQLEVGCQILLAHLGRSHIGHFGILSMDLIGSLGHDHVD